MTITSPRYISVPNKRRYHAFLEDTKLECPCGCNTRMEEQERTMWDKSKKICFRGGKKKVDRRNVAACATTAHADGVTSA